MTIKTKDDGTLRSFSSGATRDTATGKLDYEGFLHPLFLEQFSRYMQMNRVQSDGELRDSDNWQKGIPKDICFKSMTRHFMEMWKLRREDLKRSPDNDGLRQDFIEYIAAGMGMLFNLQAIVLQEIEEFGMVKFDLGEVTNEMSARLDSIKPTAFLVKEYLESEEAEEEEDDDEDEWDEIDNEHCERCKHGNVSGTDWPCSKCTRLWDDEANHDHFSEVESYEDMSTADNLHECKLCTDCASEFISINEYPCSNCWQVSHKAFKPDHFKPKEVDQPARPMPSWGPMPNTCHTKEGTCLSWKLEADKFPCSGCSRNQSLSHNCQDMYDDMFFSGKNMTGQYPHWVKKIYVQHRF